MNWASIVIIVLLATNVLMSFQTALEKQEYTEFNVNLISTTITVALIYFSGGFQ